MQKKRILALLIAISFCTGIMTACNSKTETDLSIETTPLPTEQEYSDEMQLDENPSSSEINKSEIDEDEEVFSTETDFLDENQAEPESETDLAIAETLTSSDKETILQSIDNLLIYKGTAEKLHMTDFGILYLLCTGEYKTDSELEHIIADYIPEEYDETWDEHLSDTSPEMKEKRRHLLLNEYMKEMQDMVVSDTAVECTYYIQSGRHLDLNSETGKTYLQGLYSRFDELADYLGMEHMDYDSILNIEDLYVVSYTETQNTAGNEITIPYEEVPMIYYDGHLRQINLIMGTYMTFSFADTLSEMYDE